jgi:hypothetical protein
LEFGDTQVLTGLKVAFAAAPVFQPGAELVEWYAVAGFEEAVGDGQGIVEDGVVGEVAHGKTVDPLDRTRVSFPCGIDALNGESAGKHDQAKSVNMGESTVIVCVGPESLPVALSRRKTVTEAES